MDTVKRFPLSGIFSSRGGIGEYNGKFRVNRHVPRGGSCATKMKSASGTLKPRLQNGNFIEQIESQRDAGRVDLQIARKAQGQPCAT